MCATVLIIDDDSVIRLSLETYLEDRNYRVLTAVNGRQGIEMIESQRPDVALVDLNMPDVDGFGVFAWVKEKKLDVPLIVISGTGRIQDAVSALHLGAAEYIQKPIEDISVVGYAVEKVLERERLKRENRQYQLHLEELVRERTSELVKSNRQLHTINRRLQKLLETAQGLSVCSEVETFSLRLLEEFAKNMAATGGSIYQVQKKVCACCIVWIQATRRK